MSDDTYLALNPPDEKVKDEYIRESPGRTFPLISLGPIQNLNIIVGSTNSGKSRLMRKIMNQTHLVCFDDNSIIEKLRLLLVQCEQVLGRFNEHKMHIINIGLNPNPDWDRDAPNYGRPPKEASDRQFSDLLRECNFTNRRTIELKKEFFESIASISINILQKGKDALNLNSSSGIPLSATLRQSLATILLLFHVQETPVLQRMIQIGTVPQEYIGILRPIATNLAEIKSKLEEAWKTTVCSSYKRIYIPVLRTALQLKKGDGNYAEEQFFTTNIKDTYKIDSLVEIFSGLELYKTILLNKSDIGTRRKQVTEFCRFLSENFFEKQEVDITSVHEQNNKGRLIIFSVADRERSLQELGDGIQALIIIMYKLFVAEENSLIFIEEPEVNLHPGLQRIVIDTILNNTFLKKKNLRIFMTTHSNHLLDISIPQYSKVSIFALERRLTHGEEQFVIRSVNNNRLHALTSLGVANSSVLMANCSLWVEGVTDRKYIRIYLKAYRHSGELQASRSFQEDIHFAFFEYSGSNLEHYIFAAEDTTLTDEEEEAIRGQFLANRVFLIADKDNGKLKKHSKWQSQTYDHFVYYITPGKEIENLVSSSILTSLLKANFSEYIKPKDVDSANLDYTEYQSVGLGEYLTKKFNITKGLREDSGTLNGHYKMKLANEVYAHIDNILSDPAKASLAWKLLSTDAQELTKRIYNFINLHNAMTSAD